LQEVTELIKAVSETKKLKNADLEKFKIKPVLDEK